MIALKRRRGTRDIPTAFRGDRLTQSARNLIDIYFAGHASGKYAFASSAWKPAKTALKKDSFGKCAYCEAPTSIVAHGDVEHFRPKDTYWWLAFCYDNYVFSCQICNQSYKGNKFPIGGGAIQAPPMPARLPTGAALDRLARSLVLDAAALTEAQLGALWGDEQAHLLHPYLEDPEALIVYEADRANEEVWLRSSGGTRADEAVKAADDCLGINREDLRRERYASYRALDTFREVLASGSLPPHTADLVRREIIRLQDSRQPFAGMHRFFAKVWSLPRRS